MQGAKPGFPGDICSLLHMQRPEDAEAVQADQDQIDRDDEVEESRHDQDQDARKQGNDGRNLHSGNRHRRSPADVWKSNRGRQLTRWQGSGIEDAFRFNRFPYRR